MVGYRTPFGEKINRVLAAYPIGDVRLLHGLEVLFETLLAQRAVDNEAELAAKRCHGLHPGKAGTGVVCVACFEGLQKPGGREVAATEAAPSGGLGADQAADVEALVKQIAG